MERSRVLQGHGIHGMSLSASVYPNLRIPATQSATRSKWETNARPTIGPGARCRSLCYVPISSIPFRTERCTSETGSSCQKLAGLWLLVLDHRSCPFPRGSTVEGVSRVCAGVDSAIDARFPLTLLACRWAERRGFFLFEGAKRVPHFTTDVTLPSTTRA